jgi:hypothetical protein
MFVFVFLVFWHEAKLTSRFVAWWFSRLLEENKKIFLFLLAVFHIYMKKDLKAKPDLLYICTTNRALIYICAFPICPPNNKCWHEKRRGGGVKLKSNYLESSSKLKKKLYFYFSAFLHVYDIYILFFFMRTYIFFSFVVSSRFTSQWMKRDFMPWCCFFSPEENKTQSLSFSSPPFIS